LSVLVDTSILISYERRGLSPQELLERLTEEAAVSALTVSELLVGMHRADTDVQRTQRRTFVDQVLEIMDVLPFDLAVAETHAELWAGLARRGELIGVVDGLIAATALAHGFAVLTMNIREFAHVPNLEVRSPDW
jgi:predicted nucleic acid-binding protein